MVTFTGKRHAHQCIPICMKLTILWMISTFSKKISFV
jgi:hypothetical protein